MLLVGVWVGQSLRIEHSSSPITREGETQERKALFELCPRTICAREFFTTSRAAAQQFSLRAPRTLLRSTRFILGPAPPCWRYFRNTRTRIQTRLGINSIHLVSVSTLRFISSGTLTRLGSTTTSRK